MTSGPGRFGDLGVRVLSAVALLVAAVIAFASGPTGLIILASLIGGAVVWEIGKMSEGVQPLLPALLTSSVLMLSPYFGQNLSFISAVVVIGVSSFSWNRNKSLSIASHVILIAGCFGFLSLIATAQTTWIIWLICVVVATDIAGYFAGKMFGGPKFWPSLSPKKTWSGTAGGWVAAFVVGLGFAGGLDVHPVALGLVSAVLAFASQMGDIFESFAKRRTGVKDSSNLIPGHGGVWDRFDGMLAAALAYWPLSALL